MANPSDIKPVRVDAQYKRDIERAHAEGKIEGRQAAREEMINFMQKKYMSHDVERGSAKGQAILQLTRELCELLRPSR